MSLCHRLHRSLMTLSVSDEYDGVILSKPHPSQSKCRHLCPCKQKQ